VHGANKILQYETKKKKAKKLCPAWIIQIPPEVFGHPIPQSFKCIGATMSFEVKTAFKLHKEVVRTWGSICPLALTVTASGKE